MRHQPVILDNLAANVPPEEILRSYPTRQPEGVQAAVLMVEAARRHVREDDDGSSSADPRRDRRA